MKIIFLSRSYYPNVGGVEKHIYEISKILASDGHEIVIVTEEDRHNDTKKHSEVSSDNAVVPLPGVKVLRIPITTSERRKKFQIWKWLWIHRKFIVDADVVHAHDVFYWYLPFRFFYPRKKIFTTFHGYESYPIKKKAILYRKLFEIFSNGSICVGDFMKKWYHAHPTFVTYGAVNKRYEKITPKKNSAIFIGRLDEHTGIQMYVNAVKDIRKTIPNFTLTVYGNGPLKEKIKNDGIIIKGFSVDAEKEIGNYQFSFVSRYLAILESFAAERLVFAVYDNPVKEDYLKVSPFKEWIIIENNENDLVKDIIYYLEKNVAISRKVEAAKKWVDNQTWEHMVKKYKELWRNKN